MRKYNSKTILFKPREEHHISKYRFKSNKDGKIDFKVIPYPKYKKVLKKGRKLIKIKNFKKLYITLFILLIIFGYFFITNKRISNLTNKNKSTSETTLNDRIIPSEYYTTYYKIIENNINSLVKLDSKYHVTTEAIHKNNSYIYASGTLSLKENDTLLYFDIILKDSKAYSLIINDIEYAKN